MPNSFLPYSAQYIDDEDIAAVVETLKSAYLTTGPKVREFEDAIAARAGARHAVAVSSGTAGLHTACAALRLEPGDEVVVPAVTFIATANAVKYVGAVPVFADVDPTTGLMSLDTLKEVVSDRTRAVIPVHLTGRSVDMAPIHEFCSARGIRIIDDAAHAFGTTYRGRQVGAGDYSDMSVFSFHAVKNLTTCEGGMVVTQSDELADRLRRFRTHGIEYSEDALHFEKPGPWYYEQQELGFNYRLSDVQSALGLSQLKKFDFFEKRRRELANHYDKLFEGMDGVRPLSKGTYPNESAYHLYVVLIDYSKFNTSRGALMSAMRDAGLGTQVHYIPVPFQPYYRANLSDDAFGGARAYYDQALSIPLHPRMKDTDVERCFDVIRDFLAD